MSFEGRYQVLCQKGHYFEFGVHKDIDWLAWQCPHTNCGSGIIWSNTIDDTNCDPYPNNYEIKPELKTPAVPCVCSCGNCHEKEPATYKIPTTKGRLGGIHI